MPPNPLTHQPRPTMSSAPLGGWHQAGRPTRAWVRQTPTRQPAGAGDARGLAAHPIVGRLPGDRPHFQRGDHGAAVIRGHRSAPPRATQQNMEQAVSAESKPARCTASLTRSRIAASEIDRRAPVLHAETVSASDPLRPGRKPRLAGAAHADTFRARGHTRRLRPCGMTRRCARAQAARSTASGSGNSSGRPR